MDTNYGSAAMVGWLVEEKQIEPHVPVVDKPERDDGTFSHSDFQWDETANEYRCPAGKVLRSSPNTPFRKIARSIHEPACDAARAIAKTDAYRQSRNDRKKVEMLFAPPQAHPEIR